ncbi:hypothetical protein SAY86_002469 [Trapa natans]|uniref:MADS-box domain-containing protein n=1 Tax=Trapa natans TaxID=22666 RepID=A0AAN7R2H2_TRANT|nr:hypothetical protein SAY86_002469 [Trapa natans]
MGRRKLEMKRIADKSSRQVTFSKRRSGLIKKARELSILCDVEVALLVFSSHGRLFEFCSGNSLTSVLERYQNHREEEKESKDADAQGSTSENGGKSHAELLQLVQRLVEEPDYEDFNVTDLVELEKDLTIALTQTRNRKTQLMMEAKMSLQEQERLLREEKELLEKEVATLMANSSAGEEAGPSSNPPATLNLFQ